MTPRISVVIPTYNRSRHLRACLKSLEQQTVAAKDFEVVVVVDGSTDDTVEILRNYEPPFRLRTRIQDNRGLCAARNEGNRLAEAELVLCLDDDMIAAPTLVAAHLAAHEATPGRLVQGALLIHESVPGTPYVRYEKRRLRAFDERQRRRPESVIPDDVSGGNTSLRGDLFEQAGGFDEGLRDLSDTDGELAYRLERHGVGIVYAPEALASMTDIKGLEQRLREATLYGKTYVYMHRRFPESIWRQSPFLHQRASPVRRAMRHLQVRGHARGWKLTALGQVYAAATRAAELLRITPVAEALYRLSLDHHYWKGVHEAAGDRIVEYVPRGVPILCYHDVADRRCPRFQDYVLSTRRFARQMESLRRRGYRAVSLDALTDYLTRGTPLPPRPVAITFDDGYLDLKTTATPLLARLGFPHTHFINSGKIGGRTDWVEEAPDLPLLGAGDIVEMDRAHGASVDFQAHGENHRALSGVDAETVRGEVRRCMARLDELLSRPVRYMAYPYGEYDEATPEVMASLPLHCSYTVDQGLCRPGQRPHRLPRIEIFSSDSFVDFRCKVRFGFSPVATLRRYPFRKKLRQLLGRPAKEA